MAQPIPLEMPPRDPRAELQARLHNAPLEHAEALLAAYEVLQALQDRGVLDLLRGALGSGDKIIETGVQALNTPQSIKGLRNTLILGKLVGTIEPEAVAGLARAVPEAIALMKFQDAKTPGLWDILKKLRNRDFRRGVMLATSTLEALGRNLPSGASTNDRIGGV